MPYQLTFVDFIFFATGEVDMYLVFIASRVKSLFIDYERIDMWSIQNLSKTHLIGHRRLTWVYASSSKFPRCHPSVGSDSE